VQCSGSVQLNDKMKGRAGRKCTPTSCSVLAPSASVALS
jgi:hypothetical protein